MSKKTSPGSIAQNRKARHDFSLEKQFEAGLALEGWEVKSLRAGRGQLNEAYVTIHKGEAWLLNAHISPLDTISIQSKADPTRSRKLLLNERELNQLIGAVQREGYTIVPLNLHWKKQFIKCDIALAKGKKHHDKRQSEKDKDWERTKAKILKSRS